MPQWGPKRFSFFFLNFCLILYQNAYNFVQNCKILNQSRSILLVQPKYTLENQKIWSYFSVFDEAITQETTNDIFGPGKVSFHLVD